MSKPNDSFSIVLVGIHLLPWFQEFVNLGLSRVN